MLYYVTLGTNDEERALAFYKAALAPLGIEMTETPATAQRVWMRLKEVGAAR